MNASSTADTRASHKPDGRQLVLQRGVDARQPRGQVAVPVSPAIFTAKQFLNPRTDRCRRLRRHLAQSNRLALAVGIDELNPTVFRRGD